MPLSWNEIKDRALAFSKEWVDESSEDAEAKSFWDSFFLVFGVTRRRVASFEAPVKKSDGRGGYIDLLWRGVVLVEHKSRGRDLDRAATQAFEYFPGLKERDLPRYVIVSDFAKMRLHDLDEGKSYDFPVAELYKNVRLFGFIAGYQTRSFGQEDPVNVEAAEKLGKLHDQLKASGYEGHGLEVLLVRLLFCLFAEDTAIFERRQFSDWLEQRTSDDGADLGALLALLFQVLDTRPEKRQRNLDEQLAAFPYVNGKLFAERLPLASFDSSMRNALLDCSSLDWSRISPAVFGSLFQSIMDEAARRSLGAHYTTETNILKALEPLFLDELRSEFEAVKSNSRKLAEFHKKLAQIRIFDPACGCGNFLVIAYRELRKIELQVLKEIHRAKKSAFLGADVFVLVDVDQFFGVEIEEFPVQIAHVALWLTDHQMNLLVSEEFGQYFARLPLSKTPTIIHGNALTVDWSSIVANDRLSYIVGNPPFIGHHLQSNQQKAELRATYGSDADSAGVMDYVTAWYCLAARFIQGTPIKVAFVSTNSITQGEQVGILWRSLLSGSRLHILFAHRTFKWRNEARGRAAVYCVIIGFSAIDNMGKKLIFEYDKPDGEPHAHAADQINAYLVDAPWVLLPNRSSNPFGMPEMMYGSKPTDDGNFLFTDEERNAFLGIEPGASKFMKPFVSAHEYLHGEKRWVLWLVDAAPSEINQLPKVKERIEAVDSFRKASKAASTRNYPFPALFRQITQPKSTYVLIPGHSSENRSFIPFGFFEADYIVGNSCFSLPDATLFHFGVIQSTMHMAWVRYTCGRLESRYRYSKDIVYNNFPWPTATAKQKDSIEFAAQAVLDEREKYSDDATLADLYDPLTMPRDLALAHRQLDSAVDAAYGKKSFATEADRMAFLFKLYEQQTSLFPSTVPLPKKAARKIPRPR